VRVLPVKQTIAIMGVPASGHSPEGTAVALGSSMQNAAVGVAYTYSWQVLKNNSPFASGNGSSLTFTPDDNGTHQATLTRADPDPYGDTISNTQTLTADNVAPTPRLASSFSGTVYSALPFTATATDPSAVDTSVGFNYAWDFGDGSGGTGASPSHTYTNAGN